MPLAESGLIPRGKMAAAKCLRELASAANIRDARGLDVNEVAIGNLVSPLQTNAFSAQRNGNLERLLYLFHHDVAR